MVTAVFTEQVLGDQLAITGSPPGRGVHSTGAGRPGEHHKQGQGSPPEEVFTEQVLGDQVNIT